MLLFRQKKTVISYTLSSDSVVLVHGSRTRGPRVALCPPGRIVRSAATFINYVCYKNLQEVGGGCEDWMELAQDRDRWRALVGTVMNLRVPKMRGIS